MTDPHAQSSMPMPPWIFYPEADPWWPGWRQGAAEAWLLGVWLPFWQQLDTDRRRDYLRLHPPPGEDWRTYLNLYWGSPNPSCGP